MISDIDLRDWDYDAVPYVENALLSKLRGLIGLNDEFDVGDNTATCPNPIAVGVNAESAH